MALTDVFNLQASISVNTQGYTQGLQQAANSTQSFGGKIMNGMKAIGNVSLQVAKVATQATINFAKSAVEAGQTFDSSMSQVAATMGYTTDQLNDSTSQASQNMQKLRDFAQKMGSTTAFSASEAADALNYMALAGYDAETSMSMLPNVLNLAAAGGMELATASDMVTDAQSALGLELEDMTGFVDELAKTASKSNTSVSQLGEAILTIGGTAKTLSGGTNELNTALGILADNGIKGSEGGTKLRNVILSLSAPTDKAAKKLEALGVTTVDAEGNFRPLQEIMEELSKSLDGMGTAEKADIINQIFNKQDIAAVNALLDTEADRWYELSNMIEDSRGAAEAMAGTQLDNLAGDITLFKSALEGAKIAVSDGLTPALRGLVQFGADALSRLTSAFKEGGVDGAMEELGKIISEGLGKLINKAPEFLRAGMKLLKSLAQGIKDNLPILIDAAVDIIMSLADFLVEELPNLVPAIVDMIILIVEKLTDPEMLTKLLDASVRIIVALAEGLLKAIPKLIEAIPVIIQNIIDFLQNPDMVMALVMGAVDLVVAIVEHLPEIIWALIQAIPKIIESILEAFAPLGALMIEAFSAIWSGIKDVFKNVGSWFGEKFKGAKENAEKAWEGAKEAWSAIKDKVKSAWDGISGWFGDKFRESRERSELAWQNTKTFWSGIWDTIKNAFKFGDALQWGKDLLDNFTKGIKDKIGQLKDTLKGAADKVKSFLGFSEPEEGPLSDFHTYAPDMMELFAQGIKDNAKLITDAIGSTFNVEPMIQAQTAPVAGQMAVANAGASGDIIIPFYLDGELIDERVIRATQINDYRSGGRG